MAIEWKHNCLNNKEGHSFINWYYKCNIFFSGLANITNNMNVTKEGSIYMQYLNQDKGLSCNQIMRRFPQFSKATVCRHVKRPINHNVFDKQIKNRWGQRNLQSVMKSILYVQYTVWEFPLDPSWRNDWELRLASRYNFSLYHTQGT